MNVLQEQVALVTGASRGVGRGIALGLGEAGATVYVTGRERSDAHSEEGLAGTLAETAQAVTERGGRGVALYCDHRDDAQVEAVFERIAEERDRLDMLVNSAWGGYERMVEPEAGYTWEKPFWEQPRWRWDAMFEAGVRAGFVASALATKLMIAQGRGLIVNVSYWAAQKYMANAIYGTAKAATDRFTSDAAHELRPHGVAVVSLYPGMVRTERVLRAAEFLDLSHSESPEFCGRAVAALASDPQLMDKTGQALVAARLARDYGFTDVDGTQPKPLGLEEA